MLARAEYEFAEHLLSHGDTPGEWCVTCEVFCAGALGDECSVCDPDEDVNPHDVDGVLTMFDSDGSDDDF